MLKTTFKYCCGKIVPLLAILSLLLLGCLYSGIIYPAPQSHLDVKIGLYSQNIGD